MRPIILIDNGHGVNTPGKRSPDAVRELLDSPYYFREYAWTREISQMQCDCLQALGFDAWLLVPEEDDISLAIRCERVNAFCRKYGKDNILLVSNHVNAAGKGDKWMNARGWSIYTTKGITQADYLAEEIYQVAEDEFRPPLKIRAAGSQPLFHDQEENYYILMHSYCPAVLVENFFQDNKEDVAYLKSDQGKGSCTHVIVAGIENYVRKYH